MNTQYFDKTKAEQLLEEALALYPETNSGNVRYITDGEVLSAKQNVEDVQKTRKYIEAELKAVNKMIALISLQQHYTQFPMTVRGFQQIALNCMQDCLQKGYHAQGIELLNMINTAGILDLPGFEIPDLEKLNHFAITELISGLAKRKIMTGRDYAKQATSIMLDVENGVYGKVSISMPEMLAIYNHTMINGRQVEEIRYTQLEKQPAEKRKLSLLRDKIEERIGKPSTLEAE